MSTGTVKLNGQPDSPVLRGLFDREPHKPDLATEVAILRLEIAELRRDLAMPNSVIITGPEVRRIMQPLQHMHPSQFRR